MHHPQQHLVDLSEILFRRGVSRVVISPGSRNAPLIRAFVQRFGTACISLVDERSAAYAALGIARQSQTPAVLICTSGTAVLNLAPALAEAYYQNIPLIAITADRPAEWIDQQDNQTIRQPDIYKNYIKTSFNLAEAYPGDKEMQEFRNLIQTAYSASVSAPLGPVHLNVPIPEPLYISQPKASSACDTPWEETKLPQDESYNFV